MAEGATGDAAPGRHGAGQGQTPGGWLQSPFTWASWLGGRLGWSTNSTDPDTTPERAEEEDAEGDVAPSPGPPTYGRWKQRITQVWPAPPPAPPEESYFSLFTRPVWWLAGLWDRSLDFLLGSPKDRPTVTRWSEIKDFIQGWYLTALGWYSVLSTLFWTVFALVAVDFLI